MKAKKRKENDKKLTKNGRDTTTVWSITAGPVYKRK